MKKLVTKITLIALFTTIPAHASFFTDAWTIIKRHPGIAIATALSAAFYARSKQIVSMHESESKRLRADLTLVENLKKGLRTEITLPDAERKKYRYRNFRGQDIQNVRQIKTISPVVLNDLRCAIFECNNHLHRYNMYNQDEDAHTFRQHYRTTQAHLTDCIKILNRKIALSNKESVVGSTVQSAAFCSLIGCGLAACYKYYSASHS